MGSSLFELQSIFGECVLPNKWQNPPHTIVEIYCSMADLKACRTCTLVYVRSNQTLPAQAWPV